MIFNCNRGQEKPMKLIFEWKCKNKIDEHCWIRDKKNDDREAPTCEITRLTPYLNPAMYSGFGKRCKKCERNLVKIKALVDEVRQG